MAGTYTELQAIQQQQPPLANTSTQQQPPLANTSTQQQPPLAGTYTEVQAIQQQQPPLYINTSYQEQHIYDSPSPQHEKAVRSRMPQLESQECTNRVGSHQIRKESGVKWAILLILLIVSTLLNAAILIALFTTQPLCPQPSCPQPSCPQPSCPQVTNTTQIAEIFFQEFLSSKSEVDTFSSCDNITDDNLLRQLINVSYNNTDLLEEHIDTTRVLQQLLTDNITTLIGMVGDNIELLHTHKMSTQASQQLLTNNTTTLIEMVDDNSQLLVTHINSTETAIVSSCQDVKNKQPNSPSGYYHINSQFVYCEMGELCSTEGGWTRLAYLDMTDSTVDCPPGFMLNVTAGIRSCGRPDGEGSCSSIKFPSNSISYSEVCGRVKGYQYGSPEALDTGTDSIDSFYAEGISITQGYPRKHVWTLIAGRYEMSTTLGDCPCNIPSGPQPPSFVGDDYFCESGNPTSNNQKIVYTDDPLWDGEGCGNDEGNCCSAPGLPWFHRNLTTTTDYIELRDCANYTALNENVFVSLYEIYIK